jgi:aldose 1-epimerase
MRQGAHDLVELRCKGMRLLANPALGGALLGLWAQGQPLLRSMPDDGPQSVRQSAGFAMLPYSNRLGHCCFKWGGKEHQVQHNFPHGPHALHGVGWRRPWKTITRDARNLRMAYSHARDADWPFAFEAQQHIRLRPRAMELCLTVRSTDTRRQPVGLGWHPYFVRRDQSWVRAGVSGIWEKDADQLPSHVVPLEGLDAPVSALRVDHCFEDWDGSAQIEDERFVLGLRSDLTRLVVYTPRDGSFFSVEPVAHVNNAINSRAPLQRGLVELRPGESTTAHFTLEVLTIKPQPSES